MFDSIKEDKVMNPKIISICTIFIFEDKEEVA